MGKVYTMGSKSSGEVTVYAAFRDNADERTGSRKVKFWALKLDYPMNEVCEEMTLLLGDETFKQVKL